MEGELVTIATFPFTNAADLAKLHLQEAGIPAIVTNRVVGEVMGLVQLQVRRADAKEAATILAARPASETAEAQGASAGDDKWVCLKCGAVVGTDQDRCTTCGWTFEQDADASE